MVQVLLRQITLFPIKKLAEKKTILIVGTNMMNLYHHRLELIQRLLNDNFRVIVAAPKGGEEKNLIKLGCEFIHTPVDNRGTNIKNDFNLLKNLAKICDAEKPDVILTFYTKTNIYGGLIARYKKVPYIENICGLGTSLVSTGVLSKVMAYMYKQALKKSHIVFFQNKSNIDFLKNKKIYKGSHQLLPGSGVSLTRYQVIPYPEESHLEFLFASRIMKEKGIDEYLEAAREIKKKYPETVFNVVGPCEDSYKEIIEKADNEGIIKYHGKLTDLHTIIGKSHCSVLPSYYPEGMANILLESAACGRPVITTQLPGCGETFEDGMTGLKVAPKDSQSLVDAIEKFMALSHEEKAKMGLQGRKKMEKEFDREIVTNQYLHQIKSIIKEANE